MQVKSIAGNILQYFRPALSYHLSLRPSLSIFDWPLKTGLTVHRNVLEDFQGIYNYHVSYTILRRYQQFTKEKYSFHIMR